MMQQLARIFSLLFLLFCSWQATANNGAVAYAYPIKNITIDADLSDWPTNAVRYPIDRYRDEAKKNRPGDASAYFMTGYDPQRKFLYVGVVMEDDDYVRNPDDGHYSSHDVHLLYLDLKHLAEGSGVIAYKKSADHQEIVNQDKSPWYPEIAKASWDDVAVELRREGKRTYYEWRVALPEYLEKGRAIGFDYVIFDKDEGREFSWLAWGPEVGKSSNSNRLGDWVPITQKTPLVEVAGKLSKQEETIKEWPATVSLTSTVQDKLRLNALVDSNGQYVVKVPVGDYRLSVPEDIVWENWHDLRRVAGKEAKKVSLHQGKQSEIPELKIASLPQPDLIGEQGILHEVFNAEVAKKVDAFVEAYRAYYEIPGVSLGLIKDGKLIYHNRYGVENSISQKPLREEAVFEAASITKSVFAYVMNRLQQRGDFDLSRPLYEQQPFPELEEFPEYKKMTGRHVLTHVSGLPNWGARMINEPGTKYGYSGEGFEYLKKVVAGGAGDHLPDSIQHLLDNEVLLPLGMQNTYFKRDPKLTERGVAGHMANRPTAQSYDTWPGMAFSMHTNAQDFAPFAIALLERKGLTSAQAEDMFSYHTILPEEDFLDGYKAGFGLGIALRESPYGLAFGHGGNNGDFRCQFEVYDDLKMGYIVFTNSSTGGPLVYDIFRFLVEGKERPNSPE